MNFCNHQIIQKTLSIETWQTDGLCYVLQRYRSGNPMIRNDVIIKTNGKIRTSEKPIKCFIIRNTLTKAIQNVILVKFDQRCQKLLAFK